MHHIVNFTEGLLAAQPQTIADLTPGYAGVFPVIRTADSADARDEVSRALRSLHEDGGAGGNRLDDETGWRVYWASQWWVLVGHAFPAAADLYGKIDVASPVVLLHRAKDEVYVGPEIIFLARAALAYGLVYEEISGMQRGSSPAIY